MRSILPSGSDPTTVTRSSLGTGSTTNDSCARKWWIHRTESYSCMRAVPSSRTVQECATRTAASSAGIAPVPRASATNLDGRKGPGSTMAGGGGSGQQRRRQRPVETAAAAAVTGGDNG